MSVMVFQGCNSGQKQNNQTDENENQISAELIEKQNELKQLASEEFSTINDKVRELNSRLEEEGAELSDNQKELLDEIQEMRVEANNRLNKIENVSEEEWEKFRTDFENELESIQTKLDEVLDEF
jgi:predicted  nucleic acid-binding Zn-ribbon protein